MLRRFNQIERGALRTLIGVILVKFSTGAISCWGSVNLYILSYFHHQGVYVSPQTNSMIILCTVIPISFLVLLATKISDKFGYQKIIRICSLIYFFSPLVLFFKFSFLTVLIFCVFLPSSAFSISTIPVINCLWTQFPKSKNIVTAVAVVFFSIGGVFWNFMFTIIANPHNQSTIIKDEYNDMHYFSKQVAKNVPMCMKFGCLLCGLIFVIGSHLITKNVQYQDSVMTERDLQMSSISQVFIHPSQPEQLFQRISLTKKGNKIKSKQRKTLKQALLDNRFVSIFLINFISGMYQIFLNMNIKIIYMPIINDDRFLVYCVMSATAFSIVGAVVWGYIGDTKNFYYTLVLFSILDIGIKIFGRFATTKETILILFILIGFVDKGALTIIGPGLVKIFGIETATELLPYKGLSMFIGFIFAPLGFILFNSINPFNYLFILSFLSLIPVVLSVRLHKIYGKG